VNPQECPHSEYRSKDKKKLHKQKSKKQVNLIERAKKREEKSVVRNLAPDRNSSNVKKTGLKRIKSSTALQTMFKKLK
jgi:hypothetical protein